MKGGTVHGREVGAKHKGRTHLGGTSVPEGAEPKGTGERMEKETHVGPSSLCPHPVVATDRQRSCQRKA